MLQINEQFYLICRADDSLARLASVKLRQLNGRAFIHVLRTGSVWHRIQDDLRRAAVKDTGFEVEQFSTVAGLVCAGFGISVVPQLALPLCSWQGFKAIRLSDRKIVRPLFMMKRRGRSLSIAAQALWDFILARKDAVKLLSPPPDPDLFD